MATITMPRGAKRAIKKRLNLMYDKDQAFIMWNKVVQIYNKFEQEQPDIGGKDNFLWDKIYGSLALFAYYEASERSITENEMKNGDDFCDFWQVGDKSDAWKAADKDKLL